MALSGHALAILRTGPGDLSARWLAKDGSAVTSWFAFQGQGFPVARLLMDGSVVIGFHPGSQTLTYYDVTWAYRVPDAQAAVEPLPDWLGARPGDVFWPVRNGKGYASVGGAHGIT